MKISLIKSVGAAVAACVFSVIQAFAAPYEKGQAVEGFQAKDQHEQAFNFSPANTRFLLVTHDMDTGKKANGVLTTVGPENLTKQQVVYLANIHGMPAIGRAFALPKMKKYSHRIILGDDPGLIARFPTEAGKVTVLALKDGKVVSIKYWNPGVEALDGFLK
jgi:hypothetical protein